MNDFRIIYEEISLFIQKKKKKKRNFIAQHVIFPNAVYQGLFIIIFQRLSIVKIFPKAIVHTENETF